MADRVNEYNRIELNTVIGVDKDKCVNCHACISACPVKYCNDGSGDHVTVNPDLCIGCGSCLSHCTHEARYYIDDFDEFLKELKNNEKIVAIVAPSAAANFPGQYLNLNGWLKNMGIEAIFDVSFGAELAVKSYLEYLNQDSPKAMISQACPAIVTYIEIYQPELIKYLIPFDSPMIHTIKMIKRYYPLYSSHKIAVLSPCMAKKREFIETGLGNYNISYIALDRFLKDNGINLNDFPKVNFDNPPAERAVLFSTPGGLLQTAVRTLPDLVRKTRKIEGVRVIYEYLEKLNKVIDAGRNPLLIDCLNCELGCNGGPLTLVKKDSSLDEIEYWIGRRAQEMREFYEDKDNTADAVSSEKIEETISEYWEDGLYSRTYRDLGKNVKLKHPDKDELTDIYRLMHKYTPDDIYNCTACGYNSCENMAMAIFNNLNRPENCHFYLSRETELSHQKIIKTAKQLRTIFDSSIEGLMQISKKGVIVAANPAVSNLLITDDLIGRSIFDYLDSDSVTIFRQQSSLYTENTKGTYEMNFVRPDKTMLRCLVSTTAVFDEDQNLLGEFAIVSDITERKKIERKLHESEAKYRSIFDNATEGIFQCVPDGRFLTANPAMAKIFGYDSAKVLLKSFADPGEEHRKEFKEILGKHGALELLEIETHKRDGSRIWISLNIRTIRDENRRILYYEGTVDDITKRKLVEEELGKHREHLEELVGIRTVELKRSNEQLLREIKERKQVELALKESEEKYRNIFENSVEGIFQVTPRGQYINVNPALARMHGFDSPDEMISTVVNIENQLYVNPADRADFKRLSEEYGHVYNFETLIYRKDRSTVWVSINARAVRDENGRTLYYEGTFEDITQRKRAQEEKMRLEAQLHQAQKMEAIGTLAGGVAHDFNNILTVITGYGTLLKMALEDRSSLQIYADSILSSSQKAANLTSSLLAFSRKQPITLVLLNINDVIKGTEKLLRRLLTDDIELTTDLSTEDLTVMADVTQIDQILFNLATNARDCMPEGGTLHIETKTTILDDSFTKTHGYGEPGEYVLLSVSDNGCGMNESTKERIFDPFFTTKEVGKGTGLGLSTVYGVVKQHNGYIIVHSEPDRGTRFDIYFPMIRNIISKEKSLYPEIKGGSETILVAEDNEEARLLMRDILRQYGYKVIEAVNGEDAIEKFIKHKKIELLILDSVMPKKNGKQAYDEIVKINPSIKAIFISGYTKDIIFDKGIEEGKVDFVPKPISPNKLLEKIRDVLDKMI
jgi:PAS domain S-box-containing protein